MKIAALIAPLALGIAGAATAMPPVAKSTSDMIIDLHDATCTQYARAVKLADPGKNPTKEQAALAVTAQDDLVLAMMWVNGYLTARDGAKVKHTFNQDWIVTYMGKISQICKANPGSMLLIDAAAKL
jgi:hypothetical protein